MDITKEEREDYLNKFSDYDFDIYDLPEDDKCFYDVELMKALISFDVTYIELVNQIVFEDDGFCQLLLDIDSSKIDKVPMKWRDNKEVMLRVVDDNGHNLSFASDRLRADQEIVNLALRTSAYVIEFVDKKLITEDLIINTANNNQTGEFFECLSEEFKRNINVISTLIKYNPEIYLTIPFDLQINKDISLSLIRALKKNSRARYLDGCFPDEVYESQKFREELKDIVNTHFFKETIDKANAYEREKELAAKFQAQNSNKPSLNKKRI